MSGTRTIGFGLIAGGALWLLGWAAFFLSGVPAGKSDLSAAILGTLIFGLPPALLLGVVGVVLVVKGRHEAAEMADAQFERSVLDLVDTRGTVTVGELASSLGAAPAQVEEALRDLVGKRLFTGFINWKAQRIYSEAAADIKSGKCPNCGGKLDLAGKDLVACPYCGTEIFLNRD